MPGVDPEQYAELHRLQQVNRTLGHLHLNETLATRRERRRLGISIEDEIVQHLVGARLRLEGLGRRDTLSHLDMAYVDQLLVSAITAARGIINGLSPHVLEIAGLEAALQDLGVRKARLDHITCHIDPGDADSFIADITARSIVYSLIERLLEGLVTVHHARTAWLWMRFAGSVLEITVEDDSADFDIQDIIAPGEITGTPFLVVIDEEVRCLGGEMTVERTSDIRVTTILLPLEAGSLRF